MIRFTKPHLHVQLFLGLAMLPVDRVESGVEPSQLLLPSLSLVGPGLDLPQQFLLLNQERVTEGVFGRHLDTDLLKLGIFLCQSHLVLKKDKSCFVKMHQKIVKSHHLQFNSAEFLLQVLDDAFHLLLISNILAQLCDFGSEFFDLL